MILKKVRIEGFQSFSDSGEIEFENGFNLIIGQNNSGKSALLRAMLPNFPDDRHRAAHKWETFRLAPPKIFMNINTSGIELRDWILRLGGQHRLPVNPHGSRSESDMADHIFSLSAIDIELYRSPGNAFEAKYPSLKTFEYDPSIPCACLNIVVEDARFRMSYSNDRSDSVPSICNQIWNEDMFYFSAERMAVGESSPGHASRLLPNASNLPNVLLSMQYGRGSLLKKLVEHLKEIFPTVGNISVGPRADNNQIEIRVWPTPEMEHLDLSFPLNSSGTGVAQAISILTAIMTIKKAVIIIDEINSFLHPSAVKTLLRILQTEYGMHQYIISTHAPEVISFSNPKSIHMVKRSGYESTVTKLDLDDISQLREAAQHLGVSMADVFAADRIIWVEGPTEELVFPYIYQLFKGHGFPRGTIVTSVVATGDFNRKRDRELVFDVYTRLSSAAAPLVAAAVFSFDSEGLSEPEIAGMIKDAREQLCFLPRRHIECYLLDPQAIARLINSKDTNSGNIVTSQSVFDKLTELVDREGFALDHWAGDIYDEDWLKRVDAAKLISRVVSSISNGRAEFRKKEDSLVLAEYIFNQERENLRPLFAYIELLVNKASRTQ